MPRPACGAAPPRSHTTWPIPRYRRVSPPPQSANTGTSKTRCTTRVTSLSRKINPASVVTRVSSHGYAASPTMCCAVTEPAPSVRPDTPPLSLDSRPWPTGASVECIEQPCLAHEPTRPSYVRAIGAGSIDLPRGCVMASLADLRADTCRRCTHERRPGASLHSEWHHSRRGALHDPPNRRNHGKSTLRRVTFSIGNKRVLSRARLQSNGSTWSLS